MLKEKVDELKASLSPWGNEFVMENDTKAFKARCTQDRLQVELQAVKDLGPKVKVVSDFVENLTKAYKLLKASDAMVSKP